MSRGNTNLSEEMLALMTNAEDISSHFAKNTSVINSGSIVAYKVGKIVIVSYALLFVASGTMQNKTMFTCDAEYAPKAIFPSSAVVVFNYTSASSSTQSVPVNVITSGEFRLPNQGGLGTAVTTSSQISGQIVYVCN